MLTICGPGQAILRMPAASSRPARDDPVRAKIARMQAGGTPRILDLFSGSGGLSLGLQRAGFVILSGLDSDPHAAASHALNFHGDRPRRAMPQDLTDPEVQTPPHTRHSLFARPDAALREHP